jgi:hypothetical protein
VAATERVLAGTASNASELTRPDERVEAGQVTVRRNPIYVGRLPAEEAERIRARIEEIGSTWDAKFDFDVIEALKD